MDEIDKAYNWTSWNPFPNPQNGDYLHAPFGAGVYQLRNKVIGEYILFGEGKNLAYRMSSLLPRPLGSGRRNNSTKREYVLKNIKNIEYRTVACKNKGDAQKIQRDLKKLNIHKFNT